MKKRILSVLLAFVMAFALLPATALAEGGTLTSQTLAGNVAAGWQSSMDTANWPWIVADMTAANAAGVYNPGVTYTLSDTQKQAYVDTAIAAVAAGSISSGDLAKYIIGLAALGYDARQLTTAARQPFDAAAALVSKVGTETSIYTLPYMLIALQQFGDSYAAQIDALKTQILGQAQAGGGWGYVSSGTAFFDADTTTPVLLALSPYYGSDPAVKAALDAAMEQLRKNVMLNGDGTVTSWGTKTAESTGLLTAALAALGQDPASFQEKSLTAGLLAMADAQDDTATGFVSAVYDSNWSVTGYSRNDTATEQGFRGLVAAAGYAKNGGAYRIYDFSGSTLSPAAATWAAHCPVYFQTVPTGASIVVKLGDAEQSATSVAGSYDLPAGDYTYTVSADSYQSKSGTFTVTDAEAAAHTARTLSVSLSSAQSEENPTISVSVRVLEHPEGGTDGQYTYKSNAGSYTEKYSGTVSLASGSTVFDALNATGVSFHEKTYGYIDSIDGLSELAHGPNSGWLFMVNGTVGTITCRNYALTGSASVIWFYTDNYPKEYGSENWSDSTGTDQAAANTVSALIRAIGTVGSGSGSAITAARKAYDELSTAQKELVTGYDKLTAAEAAYAALTGDLPFVDVPRTAGYYSALRAAVQKGLFTGTTPTAFSPDAAMTRSMLTEVLYRLAGKPAVTGAPAFGDVASGAWYASAAAWALQNSIVLGSKNGDFLAEAPVTREQAAVILWRYAKFAGLSVAAGEQTDLSAYTDAGTISAYALPAMRWAVGAGLLKGADGKLLPQAVTTRAQVLELVSSLRSLLA